jgi:Tol biopolymer transport system component
LVPAGRFVAIAYPRFSPDGRQLAFAAITELRSPFRGAPATALIGAPLGHGFPYEIWLVGADGHELRDVPDAINDDPSVTWSPDGTQVLVYGGWGSLLIDVASGEQTALPFLAGYGSLAWLP